MDKSIQWKDTKLLATDGLGNKLGINQITRENENLIEISHKIDI